MTNKRETRKVLEFVTHMENRFYEPIEKVNTKWVV